MKHILIIFCLILTITAVPTTTFAEKRIKDQLGRMVSIPEYPTRIVSLAPSITEIIFSLHQEHRLIGATQFSDYPAEAALLPKVGSYVHLDIEKIVALKPDLCIATKDGNPIEIISLLENLNIPVYAVDPRNLNTVMETLIEMGDLLDCRDRSRQIVTEMNSRIEKVKQMVKLSNHRPKVFYQIGISPIVSAGTDTFIHELIEMAGGDNLAKGPASYPRFSREQILAMSPDIFIITSMARGAVFERVKSEWSQWRDMPAVKHQRIMLVDSNLLDRATPRLVDGLEMLVKLIHPEFFKENN